MTTAANIPAQSPVYFIELIMEYNPTAMGRSWSELAKIREMKYSFQILIKLKMVTVIIPAEKGHKEYRSVRDVNADV